MSFSLSSRFSDRFGPAARRWWRRFIRVLAIASGLALLAVALLVGAILLYGSRDRARPADVIIVLGGGTHGTTRRAMHAAALVRQDIAPHVLCTGGYASGGITEAQRCADVLVRQGVKRAAIQLETSSRDTRANARAARAVMARHGWQSAVLVSDDYHLWRARWVFAAQSITVYPSPAQATTGSLAWNVKTRAVLREIAGVGWLIVSHVRELL